MVTTGQLGARTGVVESFDDHRGLGVVRGADDTVYDFHCTAIADGSRTIEPGTDVRFAVIAGRGGRWEAWDVEPR